MGSPKAPDRPRAEATSRRRFLALGASVFLATSGVFAFVRTRGYTIPEETRARLQSLNDWQYIVVQHVARRVAAPDRSDASIPTPDDTDVVGFVDGYLASVPPAIRRDVLRALAFVEHMAPIGAGFGARFTRLPPDDQDRVLASLESSSQDLLRGAFDGLKSLVFMGYYRDPRTWPILSYDGPLVNRPDKGWSRP